MNTNYRVNFGGGQVWYFATAKACHEYIAAARTEGRDPYSGNYRTERYAGEGEWVTVKPRGAL